VVEFPAPKAYDCAGNPLPVTMTTYSGAWFHTGLTRVEVFGPDDASGDCLYCTFDVEVLPSECPHSTQYWADHLDLWPVETLKLGCRSYCKSELVSLISYAGTSDASLILAKYLIGTKLNLNNCTDPCPIIDFVQQADGLIDNSSLPMNVDPTSALGLHMLDLAKTLCDYNDGQLTPVCGPDKALVQVDNLGLRGFDLRLNPAMPNPFDGSTSLVFTMPSAADARLSVFDLQGREVKLLLSGAMTAGRHSAIWNGTNDNGLKLPNGVYFARLTVGGNRTLMQKMVKMR
jgi:hypothetical protein